MITSGSIPLEDRQGQGRITFSDMTGSSFVWRLDFAPDGEDWTEGVFLIECTKVGSEEK